MILHAISMIASLIQETPQPPCVVKCVANSGQDPLLSRLIFAAIPSIFALGIAWLVFVWNGHKEHKRWILDQKKAEWREILDAIKTCEDFLPVTGESWKQVSEEVKLEAYERTRNVQQLFYDRLFVDHSAVERILSRWNAINELIMREDIVPALKYRSAYIELVEFTRGAARKDLGIQE